MVAVATADIELSSQQFAALTRNLHGTDQPGSPGHGPPNV